MQDFLGLFTLLTFNQFLTFGINTKCQTIRQLCYFTLASVVQPLKTPIIYSLLYVAILHL